MKSLKFCGNYQNVKQRHKVRKVCWDFCQCVVTTNLQFVKTKTVISLKYHKVKYNEMNHASWSWMGGGHGKSSYSFDFLDHSHVSWKNG